MGKVSCCRWKPIWERLFNFQKSCTTLLLTSVWVRSNNRAMSLNLEAFPVATCHSRKLAANVLLRLPQSLWGYLYLAWNSLQATCYNTAKVDQKRSEKNILILFYSIFRLDLILFVRSETRPNSPCLASLLVSALELGREVTARTIGEISAISIYEAFSALPFQIEYLW